MCAPRRERTIIRWPGRALIAAAVGATAAVVVLPAAALADAGTWGPDATPYRNGVVCDSGSVQTALAAWDGEDGGAAFGVSPIQSGFGRTDEPATSGISIPVQASSQGLSSASIAQLAYLVSTHGDDSSAGVVGDVAADVLQLSGTATGAIEQCLASGTGGVSTASAAALLADAQRLAGPYSVSLSGPSTATPAGKPIALTARVTSAAGAPVPGLAVTFGATGAGTRLSSGSAATDSQGDAHVEVRSGTGSAAAGAAVTATVQAPVGLTETSTGGNVPVVEAAAPQSFTDRLALDVDTRPDPHLQLGTSTPVLLTGGRLAQTLTVTGMNGHVGTATVSVYGPLALGGSGCAAHTAAEWAATRSAHTVAEAPQVTVTGDGAVAVTDATQLSAGCYQPVAVLSTTDAAPNVTARVTGGVVTVAPVSVTAAPGHSGLAPVGSLHTVLRATSTLASTWQDVRGELVGPRVASGGRCPTTGWDSAPSAATVTSSGTSTSSDADQQVSTGASPTGAAGPTGSTPSGAPTTGAAGTGDASDVAAVTVASDRVGAVGCYAFRLTATLSLPGIGTTTVELAPGDRNTPVHVIAPAVSVTRLSTSGVDSGGHLAATVDVTSSDGQPGSLRLELLRLPYTYRGCFDADWTRATVVRTRSTPVAPTRGDNTYRVSTAAVPGSACWTVVPVFTASANPAVSARSTAGGDPMLAFTSTERPASGLLASATPEVGSGTAREVAVGLALAAIVLGLLLGTLVAARAGRRDVPIDPRDQLFGPSGG